jgi:hypothetical protein
MGGTWWTNAERRVLRFEIDHVHKEDIMKTITSLALVAMLVLLGSCTINPHPMDMTQAVQSAKTRSDDESLASIMKMRPKTCRQRRRSIKGCWPNTKLEKVFMGSKLKV